MQDEGHLTNRNHLPVTQLNFAGSRGIKEHSAKFELGPLYCSGRPSSRPKKFFSSSPSSCKDLLLSGVTETGYYMVKSRAEKFPKVVFCDMSKQPNKVGFQRTFGSPGNLRPFSAFDVSIKYLKMLLGNNLVYVVLFQRLFLRRFSIRKLLVVGR